MLITQAQLKEYTARYNNLPDDVEAAYDKLLKNPNRLKVIRGALRIIKKHDATDYLGLFLLHRHFACKAGSVFVERRYTPTRGHAQVLVTQAERLSNAPRWASPHRFSIDAKGVVRPLEFSTDVTVAAANRRLVLNKSLSQEICSYIASNGFSSTLGVAIFPRSGTAGRATSVFLEETNFDDRTSVVHLLPQLPREVDRAIQPYGHSAIQWSDAAPAGASPIVATVGHLGWDTAAIEKPVRTWCVYNVSRPNNTVETCAGGLRPTWQAAHREP